LANKMCASQMHPWYIFQIGSIKVIIVMKSSSCVVSGFCY